MQKTCQNCNQTFECKMDNITECSCYGVKLTESDKLIIASKFTDCLCNKCFLLITENKK